MPRFNYKPGDFDGEDTSNVSFDNDSGFTDTVENIETFTAPSIAPGEVYEISARLTLSTDPGEGPIFLEIREEDNGDILARDVIEEFSNAPAEVSLILPAWAANGDFGPPADNDGDPEVRVNNTGGSSVNYFVDTVAVRIRGPFNDGPRGQVNNQGGFDSGQF